MVEFILDENWSITRGAHGLSAVGSFWNRANSSETRVRRRSVLAEHGLMSRSTIEDVDQGMEPSLRKLPGGPPDGVVLYLFALLPVRNIELC